MVVEASHKVSGFEKKDNQIICSVRPNPKITGKPLALFLKKFIHQNKGFSRNFPKNKQKKDMCKHFSYRCLDNIPSNLFS